MSDLYDNYVNLCLGQNAAAHVLPDLDDHTINCAICDEGTDYAPAVTDVDYDEVTHYLNTTDQTLGSKDVGTTTPRVFDAADLTFSSVVLDTGKQVDVLVHYYDTGTATTSPLICFHDAFTPVIPNGGNIVVAYNGSGIFKL